MTTATQVETETRPDYARAAKDFRMLGDMHRLSIVRMLASGPRNVAELAEGCGLAQSAINHHLSALRLSRAIEAERRGQRVYYSLVATRFADCAALLLGWADLAGEAEA